MRLKVLALLAVTLPDIGACARDVDIVPVDGEWMEDIAVSVTVGNRGADTMPWCRDAAVRAALRTCSRQATARDSLINAARRILLRVGGVESGTATIRDSVVTIEYVDGQRYETNRSSSREFDWRVVRAPPGDTLFLTSPRLEGPSLTFHFDRIALRILGATAIAPRPYAARWVRR